MSLHYRMFIAAGCLIGLIAAVFASSSCHAALVLTIGNGEIGDGSELRNPAAIIAQGGTGSLRVSLRNDGDTFVLSGFSLYFDVGGAGFGLPAGVSVSAVDVAGGYPGSIGLDYDSAQVIYDAQLPVNYDFSTFVVASDVTVQAGESIDLFDFVVAAGSDAALGIHDITLVMNPHEGGPNVFSTTPAGIDFSSVGGSFEVTAVPEPGSMAVLGVLGGVAAWKRRRTKAKKAAESALAA